MSALAILERSFRPLQIPDRVSRTSRVDPVSGIYLLVDTEIVYVGSSADVIYRVWCHHRASKREQAWSIDFDYALWYPLPSSVLYHYEGAFIRALRPECNLSAPRHDGYDNEILEGFGLPPHADESANCRDFLSVQHRRRLAAREERESN